MLKGILLDVDGTLVLSNDAHAESWVSAFGKFGYTLAYEDVRRLIGMGGDKLMPALVKTLNSESGVGKEISEYRSKLFQKKYAPRLEPVPGGRKLVKKLQADGHKLIVASSAKERELETLLKAAKVDDLLQEATTSSDVDNSKPDPDIVQVALDKISLSANQVLMIGDTPYDIEAAGRAGVRVVAVRCGGCKDEELKGAIEIYNDPADILANYDSSPFCLGNLSGDRSSSNNVL